MKELAQSEITILSSVLQLAEVLILQNFSVLNLDFTGAFGEVRRAIHLQTNVTRAVKIIKKKSLHSKEQQESLINEVNILKKIVLQIL